MDTHASASTPVPPPAAAASPPTPNHAAYLSSLDFFTLAGLDGHTPPASDLGESHSHSPSLFHAAVKSAGASAVADTSSVQASSASPALAHGHGGYTAQAYSYDPHSEANSPLDDPSPITLDVLSRTSSGHGHQRPHLTSRHSHGSTHGRDQSSMDVDNNAAASGSGSGSGSGNHHQHHSQRHSRHANESGHNTPALDAHDFMTMDMSGASYDAIQAGILQHQLESIHMQSPFVAATNPTSPYGAMAQMFLTSPPGNSTSGQLPDNASSSQGQSSDSHGGDILHRRYRAAQHAAHHGVLTPGPSGDIVPEMHMDLMSPMQLGAMMDGKENFHNMPLLSPALSHHASSNYASPVAQVAFNTGGREGPGGSHNSNQAALEQLQLQQRQFQEQLALLQEQQRQLQATAAAVAAASSSPYMLPTQPHSQSRQSLAPGSGGGGPHSSGSVSTPSPGGYFSPLTSPALEPAASRNAAFRAAAQHMSPAMHAQSQRAPHPLSNLSSPALNPVGSSGGANQTLSPALGPQSGADSGDPEYLHALQGIIDGNHAGQSSGEASHTGYQGSPVIGPSPGSGGGHSSPAVGPSGTGPHRSMPSKSRPSPMMKPTNHRSHGRQTSSTSVPTSPMAFKMPGQNGMGFLPPAAIDNRGAHQLQQHAGSSSTTSTPSPVDLAQIMPPPPVPSQNARPKVPMTPTSLMNLGKTDEAESTSPQQSASGPVPQRAAAKKATTAIAPSPSPPAAKRGSRLVPASSSAAAKRALAIRPPGVGVRAATKGAAAAAAAANEPETRRTSHKAAEQKRRDSLKAGFDELRLLLPPINTEALDPESGEPIPGSSAPRLLPKSSLVPDDNPNRGVSKVALLKFSNEYIVRLHDKVNKRDGYIDKLRAEVQRLRAGEGGDEVRGDDGEDLLEMDMLEGEEDDLGTDDEEEGDGDMDIDQATAPRKKSSASVGKSPALGPTAPRRKVASAARRKSAAEE